MNLAIALPAPTRTARVVARIAAFFAGWRAVVEWDGRVITHRADSFADALAWSRCYPADAAVRVTRHGFLYAVRPAL